MNESLDSEIPIGSDSEWSEGWLDSTDGALSSAVRSNLHTVNTTAGKQQDYSNNEMTNIISYKGDVDMSEDSSKRKRKRKYYLVNDFPVLFKNDLRRRYPTMFMNVLNQNDTQLLRQFYDSFASIHCRHVSSVPMVVDSLLPGLPTPTSSTTIATFADLRTVTIPDGTVQLEACQIKRWKGQEGCHIDMRVIMKGTKLFEVPMEELVSQICQKNDNTIKSEMIKRKSLMNMPIEIRAEGLLALKLDHEHRILEVSLNCSNITATPVFL